jgi:hypothetical protein
VQLQHVFKHASQPGVSANFLGARLIRLLAPASLRRASNLEKNSSFPGSATKPLTPGWMHSRRARQLARFACGSVRAAREEGLGIFDAGDPLRLEPFKVRYLSRQRLPDRRVIYLSDGGVFLIPPQEYQAVSEAEDRLFIPRSTLVR